MDITQEQLQAALAVLQVATKNASTTPNYQSGHGPGGLFSTLGVNQQIINAAPMPVGGLLKRLKVSATRYINPLQQIYTGIAADSGTDPAGFCDPGKIAGSLEAGVIGNAFGRYVRSTKTINVSDTTIGGLRNRGELEDFTLLGGMTNDYINALGPTPPKMTNPLTSEYTKVMTEYLIGWYMAYSRNIYLGNPASNAGGIKYFRGLDILINTGYTDAESGAALTNANATVISNAADLSNAMVPLLINAWRYQKDRAEKMGYNATFAFVMTKMMFYELSAVWPSAYYTSRAAVAAGVTATVFIDSRETITDRDSMRKGNYLLMDGEQVEVIIDDSIKETALTAGDAGKYSSSIYLLPMTVSGEQGLTVEYFDYNNGDTTELLKALNGNDKYFVTNNGRFLWVRRENGFCISFDCVENSRLFLKFPFLSTRITGTKVLPSQVLSSGFNDDGSRYVLSGAVSRPTGTYNVTP